MKKFFGLRRSKSKSCSKTPSQPDLNRKEEEGPSSSSFAFDTTNLESTSSLPSTEKIKLAMSSSEAPPLPNVEVELASNDEGNDDNKEEYPLKLSGFDRFERKFKDLEHLISDIHETFDNPAGVDPGPALDTNTNAGRRREIMRTDVSHILMNVEYIKKNVKPLMSSSYSNKADVLLGFLMDAAEKNTVEDFPIDSENLKHLLLMINKLKIWVPLLV